MAVPSIISAEQYHDIFGSSEEENNNREEENNTADSDGSDIDVQEVESDLEEDESDSESDNDSNASDTIEWSDELEDFDIDEFSGRQEMKFNVPDNVSANDFFSQLFGDSIMDIIVTETNRYARQKLANTPRLEKWKDIKQELRAYFGICIIMGINNLPRIATYWSTDPFIGNTGIQSVMARNRFEELSQYLHFTNSETEPPRGDANFDRLFKIRPILSIVLNNIQHSVAREAHVCPCGRAKAKVCALQQSRPKNAERLQGGDTLRVQSVQSCTLPNNVPQFVPRSSRVTHFNLTLFCNKFRFF